MINYLELWLCFPLNCFNFTAYNHDKLSTILVILLFYIKHHGQLCTKKFYTKHTFNKMDTDRIETFPNGKFAK